MLGAISANAVDVFEYERHNQDVFQTRVITL